MQHLPWREFTRGGLCVRRRCLCIYRSAMEWEHLQPDLSWSAEHTEKGTTVAVTRVILLQGLRAKPDLSIHLIFTEDVNLQCKQGRMFTDIDG